MYENYKANKKLTEIKGYIMYATLFDHFEQFSGIPQHIIFIPAEDYNEEETLKTNFTAQITNNNSTAYELYFQFLKCEIPQLKQKLNKVNTITVDPSATFKHWKSFKVFYGTLIFDTTYNAVLFDTNEESVEDHSFAGSLSLTIDKKNIELKYTNTIKTGLLRGFYSIDQPDLNAFSTGKRIINDAEPVKEYPGENIFDREIKKVEIRGYIMYATLYDSLKGFDGIPQDIIIIPSEDYNQEKSLRENFNAEMMKESITAHEVYFQFLKRGVPELKEKLQVIHSITVYPLEAFKHWESFRIFYGTLIFDATYNGVYPEEKKLPFIEALELKIADKNITFFYTTIPETGDLNGFYPAGQPELKVVFDPAKAIQPFKPVKKQ